MSYERDEELARLQELNIAHRAEIKRLRLHNELLASLVREAMPFMSNAGDDEDPEAQAVACEWLDHARSLMLTS